MRKKQLSALLLSLALLTLTGCETVRQTQATPTAETPVETAAPTPTPEPTPTPDPIAEQVAGLSTEEKVGQLLIAGIEGTQAGEDARSAIQDYKVGGIILFSRNVESAGQLTALTNDLKDLAGDQIPLFLSVDEEGGRVSRMPPEVADLPSAYQYIQDGGDAAARGTVLAAECKAFGFNVDFAPSLDIWSNPENTVIGDRAFGTDWEWAGTAGCGCYQAMLDGGIIPVAKHFPGHGDTAVDSHVALPVVTKTVDELKQSELMPFIMAMDGDDGGGLVQPGKALPAVMVAHILMTAIDPDLPASLSPKVVTGLLREDLGFDGVVFTDDLTMGAVSNTYGMGEAAVLALEAGCDELLVCHKAENLRSACDAVLAAVNSGRISQARLDESVSRVLRLKAERNVNSEAIEAPDVDALNAQIQAILP